MSGNNVVLDTNTLIYMSKGLIDEEKLLAKDFDRFYVSVITYMELYGFNFKDSTEKQRLDEYFKYIEIVHTNTLIAEKTMNYRKNGPRKIKLPDAIILATTAYLNATLLTGDWDDFLDFDDDIVVANLDDLWV